MRRRRRRRRRKVYSGANAVNEEEAWRRGRKKLHFDSHFTTWSIQWFANFRMISTQNMNV